MYLRGAFIVAAAILLAAGQQAAAAPVTVQDNYWGLIGYPGATQSAGGWEADVIGDPAAFDIMSATVSRAGDNLTITVNTNYNAADFNITQFGDLFIAEGADWQPNGTAANHYQTDDLSNTGTVWKYAIQTTGLNADATPNQGVVVPPTVTGTATAYALGPHNGGIITSNIGAAGCSQQQYGNPYTGGCNYVWRYDQPVQVATQDYTAANSPDGVAVTGATLDSAATGVWSFGTDPIAGYDLSYTFDAAALDPNLLVGTDGYDIAFSWAMTCSNDIIQGAANTVPEPSSLLLMTTGLLGLAWRQRRRGAAG